MKLAQTIKRGFTLIELLVVIGILAILLAITLIAINPARQFQQANDTKRSSDVNAILNAVSQYAADNKGALPAGITTTVKPIAGDAAAPATVANICAALVPQYIAALPVDPTTDTGAPITEAGCAADHTTGYTIVTSATDSRVTVSATGQITNPISVTR